ncbi:uncharacterized protein N7483_002434 [Penicillium malachiteum]|uniref:uncharacterized protein n=1 Tax=Penicillium malachiteum TaxID=1324776 RepID=UPI0025492012|nr:uncharacterized protein N7483_002434 [Penicillium malachiteum]KAJ5737309.1 hypothetical protein N7483_002434 [Penicillium malachiteum]
MASISFSNTNLGSQVGINQGSITNQYLPPERSAPRPEPLSTVPFPHDPDFVYRGALDQIHEKLSAPGSRIALVGLGGVGKTRLAIEYCHQVRRQSIDTWVFWVHASNAARCEKSLRDLADRAKIPGRQDRNANIFQLFGNWLQDKMMGKWILVLDNVDDDELLRKPSATSTETQANAQSHASTQSPLRYLLERSNGSIIITSRNKGVALDITGHKKDLIDIQPMDVAEAQVLLQNKLDIHIASVDMVQLVKELELMPLAIIQAASYIVHRSPRCSVSQYLEKLRRSDRHAAKLLHREAGPIHRDWEAKNSILLTWQISFDHIQRIRQSAADLLSLMSFFDRQGIPEKLLRVQDRERKHDSLSSPDEITKGSSEEDIDSSSESYLDDDFEDDIATLRDYSFIYTGEDSTVYTMHRLVQLTARVWLSNQGQMEQWKERFITNLCQEFPTGEYENWTRCRQLFPHVKSAISLRPESQDALQQWATLLYRGAWYAWQMGNVTDAKELASKSRKQRVAMFGADGEEALDSTAMLAAAYMLEGRWEEAEQLQVRVMDERKTKLGDGHPDTLMSMHNLAATYWRQGRWEEAEQLQVQVMEARKAKLGNDHPDTLTSMVNLAATYWKQRRWEEAEHGRWEEAERLQVQVIKARKAKLGDNHPDTLTSIAFLASAYCDLCRWEEAEQLQVQVIEARKATLGNDHPDTLMSMHNLAATYICQGQWKEAEQLQVQVIEARKTKLGDNHPDTLMSMQNLAATYWRQGRWKEAEHGRWEEADQLQVQVIEARKATLGNDHPDTLMSMHNLAATYICQGRWKEAEQLLVQVIDSSKMKLGENHPSTLASEVNLALTYKKCERVQEAEKLLERVVETRKTNVGDDHPDTLSGMANLALVYESQGLWPGSLSSENRQGRMNDALDLLQPCLAKQSKKLSPNHPHTLATSEILLEWASERLNINK